HLAVEVGLLADDDRAESGSGLGPVEQVDVAARPAMQHQNQQVAAVRRERQMGPGFGLGRGKDQRVTSLLVAQPVQEYPAVVLLLARWDLAREGQPGVVE